MSQCRLLLHTAYICKCLTYSDSFSPTKSTSFTPFYTLLGHQLIAKFIWLKIVSNNPIFSEMIENCKSSKSLEQIYCLSEQYTLLLYQKRTLTVKSLFFEKNLKVATIIWDWFNSIQKFPKNLIVQKFWNVGSKLLHI